MDAQVVISNAEEQYQAGVALARAALTLIGSASRMIEDQPYATDDFKNITHNHMSALRRIVRQAHEFNDADESFDAVEAMLFAQAFLAREVGIAYEMNREIVQERALNGVDVCDEERGTVYHELHAKMVSMLRWPSLYVIE